MVFGLTNWAMASWWTKWRRDIFISVSRVLPFIHDRTKLFDSDKVHVFGKAIKKLKLYSLKYEASSGKDSFWHCNIK